MATKSTLPIVGMATGRNGDWNITGLSLWGSDDTTFIDPLGMRGTAIERAGLVIETPVFIDAATRYLEQLGYSVTKESEAPNEPSRLHHQ